MKRTLGSIFLLWLYISSAAAQKQSTHASGSSPGSLIESYKLTTVKVTGTARYTDKEILGASGLQIGQNAADGDFKEVVQRLGNSGLFSNVSYSYITSSAGVKLDLQLADTDKSKLVPVNFENFVWFTDDELRTALQNRVPLFKQLLPIDGNLPDRVSEALQVVLTEKHFPGRVSFLREGDESSGSLHAIDYQVEEVSIRIRDLEFPGATPEHAALLAKAAHRAVGAEYTRNALAAVAEYDLLPVYLQRGYLKAAFGPADAHVLPEPSTSSAAGDAQGPAELQVDAIIPVIPGKAYSTSGVIWKGTLAISSAEVAALLHLPLGQPADAVRLLRDIETVGKLYRSRGYMMVAIKPEVQLDDEKSTVHYDLNVVEGDLYKMGEIEITGLGTQASAQMRGAWKLLEGQPYNDDYPDKFLNETRKIVPDSGAWAVTKHVTPDVKSKTVDVEIHFKQQ
jgi:outer membrane protein assembly factor BamA